MPIFFRKRAALLPPAATSLIIVLFVGYLAHLGGALNAQLWGPYRLWHLLLCAGAIIWGAGGGDAAGGEGGGTEAAVSHILVEDAALCEHLRDELTGAEDLASAFAAAADRHSICETSKSWGGSLGQICPGLMPAEFDEVCWAAPLHEVPTRRTQRARAHHAPAVAEPTKDGSVVAHRRCKGPWRPSTAST